MVKNSKLYDTVITEINREANKDPSFKVFSEGDENLGKSIIESMGKLQVDEKSKVRFMFSKLMGYGYDFNGDVEGTPAKDMYENAIEKTKQLGGVPMFETFISEGVDKENNFGWYVTKI